MSELDKFQLLGLKVSGSNWVALPSPDEPAHKETKKMVPNCNLCRYADISHDNLPLHAFYRAIGRALGIGYHRDANDTQAQADQRKRLAEIGKSQMDAFDGRNGFDRDGREACYNTIMLALADAFTAGLCDAFATIDPDWHYRTREQLVRWAQGLCQAYENLSEQLAIAENDSEIAGYAQAQAQAQLEDAAQVLARRAIEAGNLADHTPCGKRRTRALVEVRRLSEVHDIARRESDDAANTVLGLQAKIRTYSSWNDAALKVLNASG